MEYKYQWYIPDAYLHSRGTGYFTSHEGCAFIKRPTGTPMCASPSTSRIVSP